MVKLADSTYYINGIVIAFTNLPIGWAAFMFHGTQYFLVEVK